MRRGPIFWPLLLITAGVIALLSNFEVLPPINWGDVWRLWPLILIAIGLDILISRIRIGSGSKRESLAFDLDEPGESQVRIEFGAGQLHVGAGAPPGKLLEGEFGGGVEHHRDGGQLWLKMPSWGPWWWERDRRWEVRLTDAVPLRLRLQTGASQAELDLSELRVIELRVESGAANTVLRLPQAAGYTRAEIETGAASSHIYVPAGVGARIRAAMALGSLRVDRARFTPSGGEYVSPDYETAANKVELKIQGGVGEVVVE